MGGGKRWHMVTETTRIKVLHIDDDMVFLELFRSTYGEDFDIISLTGGEEVLDLLEREHADALVLDYELPGKKGLDVLRAVRERYPSMPVVFYTGQGSEEVARHAFKAGATDYFVKEASDFVQKEKIVNSVQKAVEMCAVEAELEEKQAMLEGIIDFNPYSILIADKEGRPVRVNRAHTKLFALSPSREAGALFDESLHIPEEVKAAIIAQAREVMKHYTLFEDPRALQDEEAQKIIPIWKAGDVVKLPPLWYTPPIPVADKHFKHGCVSGTGFSVKDSKGDIAHYVQMHEDITARVQAEEAARQAHEDLAKSHEELKRAYESVERKVAERTAELAATNCRLSDANKKLQARIAEGDRLRTELKKRNGELEDFAYMVSHNLRNNLLVIESLVGRGVFSLEEVKSTHQKIIANTVSLRDFVERLLILARAGRAIARKEEVSLAEMARKAFLSISAAHPEAELRIAPDIPPVLCDPGAFGEVFSNLFSNALTYGNDGAKTVIDVTSEENDEGLELTVRDNGQGIDAKDLPHLFEVTFTTGGKGRFGFGLAIVKKLVEAHDGSVRARSEGPGNGSAFVISLPRG
jgi:signal transduction histidine kinase/FixJ family two-component response regulator